MKTHKFTVTLSLSENIVDDDAIKEMAYKIADALRHECDSGMGLAPEQSDAYTNMIEIEHQSLREAKTIVDMLSGAGSSIIQS